MFSFTGLSDISPIIKKYGGHSGIQQITCQTNNILNVCQI